ncbi:hypothetical protein C1645_870785 [Glomus cerebriforme]|uniref:Uncharacterized protein n=1 Tax=Glomus cerebriforme TaxID=658196 RepID=A0A397TN42_9GLOM|nr:hypothetical protein C1645_870785 [Glomus cerebriforme]
MNYDSYDLIAINGVSAAIALKAVFEKHEIPGKVVLFGTPAEEMIDSKIALLKADLHALKPRIYKCVEAAAEATGCTKANGAKDPKITHNNEVFDVNTNIPLGERYEEHLRRFGIEFMSKSEQGIALTGLDFLIDDEFAKQVKDSFNGGLHWKIYFKFLLNYSCILFI